MSLDNLVTVARSPRCIMWMTIVLNGAREFSLAPIIAGLDIYYAAICGKGRRFAGARSIGIGENHFFV